MITETTMTAEQIEAALDGPLGFRTCTVADPDHEAEFCSYFGPDGYSLKNLSRSRSIDEATEYQGEDWLITHNPQGPPSMIVGADFDAWVASEIEQGR